MAIFVDLMMAHYDHGSIFLCALACYVKMSPNPAPLLTTRSRLQERNCRS